MKRKIGRTLLLSCIVAIIYLSFLLTRRNEALAREQEQTEAEARQEMIDEIMSGDEEIIYLRNRKKENCEKLGFDMPFSLIETCGKPKE